MNIKVQPKIHNRFDIYKKNVVTGEEKQVGYAENIVLDSIWSRLCSGSTYFVNIHYGTGTGTLDPTRTSLFTHLGTGAASNVETVRAIPTSHWRRSITLGLTSANGSELTEVGIAYGSSASNLVTHAQIRDMNGNVISILKTDVDIITIYATVYITMVNTDANVKLLHPNYNGLISYLVGGSFPGASFSAGMGAISADWPLGLTSYSLGSVSGSWSNDVANKKRITSTMRFGTTTANGHIKELAMSNIARIVLPVSGIYSGLELSGVPLGIGDGVTDTYVLPSLNADQSSITVKVDGAPESATFSDSISIFLATIAPIYEHYSTLVAFSGNGLFYATNASDVKFYKFINNAWAGLGNISDAIGYAKYGCFSFDGTYFAHRGSATSAKVAIYKNINDLYTHKHTISVNGTVAAGIALSPDNKYIAIPHAGTPYLTVSKNVDDVWSVDFSDATLGACSWCDFSNDGNYLAVAHSSSPYLTIYENIENVWTKMTDITGGSPSAATKSCCFSPDSKLLAISQSTSPYLTVYENDEGVWTKLPEPVLSGSGRNCSFSHDSKYIMNGASIVLKEIDGVWTEIAANEVNYFGITAAERASFHHFSPGGPFIGYSYNGYHRLCSWSDNNTVAHLATAPAPDSVITADYTVLGIHKTDQRVIDISGEIQFGEPT